MKKLLLQCKKFIRLLSYVLFMFAFVNFSNYASNDELKKNNLFPEKGLQFTVEGTVTEKASGEPLPGVSILVKGTTTGTVTDVDGNYTLEVPNENAVVIRYAEMLLNLAEAENELNGPAAAAPHVNRIRNRVGLEDLPQSLSQDEMREAIRKERRLELAFEGHQYFDLLRYGPEALRISMEEISGEIPGHDRIFEPRVMRWPLPQREVDVNPNLLPQNPGW